VAFGFGCTYLARLEEDGLGAQWDRITIRTLPDDDFNLSYCILMLMFDSVLYMCLALYIEAVFPGMRMKSIVLDFNMVQFKQLAILFCTGDSGMPKPWYFMCQKSFWKRRSSLIKDQIKMDNYEAVTPSTDPAFGNIESLTEYVDLRIAI